MPKIFNEVVEHDRMMSKFIPDLSMTQEMRKKALDDVLLYLSVIRKVFNTQYA